LCRAAGGACRHALLLDASTLSQAHREQLVREHSQRSRLLMLGVDSTGERSALLARGCGEALGRDAGLRELEVRARRLAQWVPCQRTIGQLTLDLFHRDVQHGSRWLALHPREFGVLWRLAESPGRSVSRSQLLRDVWRLNHDPETNSVAVHVSRLRSKLAELGCAGLVSTDPAGGYWLDNRACDMCRAAEAALEDG
jgi:DNA-binding response OmpR family regulator